MYTPNKKNQQSKVEQKYVSFDISATQLFGGHLHKVIPDDWLFDILRLLLKVEGHMVTCHCCSANRAVVHITITKF